MNGVSHQVYFHSFLSLQQYLPDSKTVSTDKVRIIVHNFASISFETLNLSLNNDKLIKNASPKIIKRHKTNIYYSNELKKVKKAGPVH